jgi:LPS-assembly protein
MRAEGNARFTEADGKVVHGEIIDLTEDFRDGFVDSLQLEAADKTRFAAPRARTHRGRALHHVPERRLHRLRALQGRSAQAAALAGARDAHHSRRTEKMIYFEERAPRIPRRAAVLLAVFSTPDPTVKRKSGVLYPKFSFTSQYGGGLSVPYFWALAPNYDFTLTPLLTTKQGLLLQGEWRHRLINGSYAIRAAGIVQANPGRVRKPHSRRRRSGQPPVPRQLRHHRSVQPQQPMGLGLGRHRGDRQIRHPGLRAAHLFHRDGPAEVRRARDRQPALSDRPRRAQLLRRARDVFLRPLGERRSRQLPIVHAVIDYKNKLAQPLFGGELTYRPTSPACRATMPTSIRSPDGLEHRTVRPR